MDNRTLFAMAKLKYEPMEKRIRDTLEMIDRIKNLKLDCEPYSYHWISNTFNRNNTQNNPNVLDFYTNKLDGYIVVPKVL